MRCFPRGNGPVDRIWASLRRKASEIVKERDTVCCYQTANPSMSILSVQRS